MPVRRFEELSSAEVAALDRDHAAVFVSLSPIEEHGPHLPLGVDLFEAHAIAEAAAADWCERHPGDTALVYPPIPLGSMLFDLPGSIEVSRRTIYGVVRGIGESLARHGFRRVAFFSAHGGPSHSVAIEQAVTNVNRRFRSRMVAPLGRYLFDLLFGRFDDDIERHYRKLTDDERRDLRFDPHAGRIETSLMLHLRRDLVNPDFDQLPPVFVPIRKLRPWTLKQHPRGYFGAPALADAAFGAAVLAAARPHVAGVVECAFAGRNVSRETRSAFFFVPLFRVNFVPGLVLVALLLVAAVVAIILT